MKDNLKRFGFTFEEIKEILISSLILAFVFFYPGLRLFSMPFEEIVLGFAVYFLIIIFAFIPHELAHKFSAMHYKCVAKYKILWPGLKMALVLAIVTNGYFVIAAPGAVVVYSGFVDMWGKTRSVLTKKQDAIISASGPAANILVASVMVLFFGDIPLALSIAYVNSFLAMFNMIPIPPFDGYKVFKYDKRYWGALMLFAILMM